SSRYRARQKRSATLQCTLCPKKFTRSFNLRSHLRTHGDIRPFSCSQCDRTFTRQHDCKEHEKLHSGDRPFVCGGELGDGRGQWGCGRRFARRAQLTRHFSSLFGLYCTRSRTCDEEYQRRR
ncbi:hypothetical protein Micbo1qcDRAFT_110165, partial [Microdochium bolleyi]